MRKRSRRAPRGYVLHEDGKRVVIATLRSSNRKTGDVVQVWIMPRYAKPTDAMRNGRQTLVCGGCKLQPRRGGGCYVAPRQLNSIYRAYQRGSYPYLPASDYPAVLRGRMVRLGAWGDPAFIPPRIVDLLVRHSKGHTGYTHQWKHRFAEHLRGICMASADSPAEALEAAAAGWGVFLVRPIGAPVVGIQCPSVRGKRCANCGLCDGRAVTVSIEAHGAQKRTLSERLVQIAGVAA
jgi:hypothetical protein